MSPSSLTTLFVVGPEEYVEFNETMGSKAFLEHVWDQSRTPLKNEETSASGTHLHSAGARISNDPPPRIEFPTVLRIRGKGNTYKTTGNWISWDDLKKKNPLALRDPPSLEEFIRKGGNVGIGDKIEPGGWLKSEKRFKVTKRKKDTTTTSAGQTVSDGWIGGSSESIYATSLANENNGNVQHNGIGTSSESIYAPRENKEEAHDGWLGGSNTSAPINKPKIVVKGDGHNIEKQKVDLPGKEAITNAAPRQLRKSRSGLSLSERLGMGDLKEASMTEPMPSGGMTDKAATSPEAKSVVAAAAEQQRNRPPNLDFNNQRELPSPSSSDSFAQTPLSATHPPPETPLKHIWRDESKRVNIPPTPRSEEAVHNATSTTRGTGRSGGLLLDPGEGVTVLPQELQTPQRGSFGVVEGGDTPPPPPTMNAAKSQIDQMLARLRLARSSTASSGGGTQESRWAVKDPESSHTPSKVVEKKSATEEGEAKATSNEIPTAPRAIREAQQSVNSSQHAPVAPAPKSLLDRLSAAPVVETTEKVKTPTKGKKERKRGSRKNETRQQESMIESSSPPNLPVNEETTNETIENERAKAVAQTSTTTKPAIPEKNLEPTPKITPEQKFEPPVNEMSHEEIEPVSERSHEEMEEEVTNDQSSSPVLVPSASAASFSTEPSIEGSNVGNDTLTSINWADDDDDDTMPELPEEWTRGSPVVVREALPTATNTFNTIATSPSLQRTNRGERNNRTEAIESVNENPKRGAKRGGKGRVRKDKEEEQKQGVVPPRAPRGLRIAGSAASVGASGGTMGKRKELFPLHVSSDVPRGPMAERERSGGHREQRPHGRPKLMESNKEAFGRLTKGALGIPPPSVGGQEPNKGRKQ